MEYIENVQAGDFESTFRNYAERGYDLIMAAGTQFDEAANKVAPSYPNSTFCVVNGLLAKTDNAMPIFPKEYEASFLAGIFVPFYGPKIDADVRDAVQNGMKAAIAGEIDFKSMFSGKC